MKKLSVSLLAAVVLLLGVGCVPKIHISIGDSETSISEPSNTEKGSLSDEENNFVADNSNSSSEQETEETARNPSWMTQDQADRLAEAESARLKRRLCLPWRRMILKVFTGARQACTRQYGDNCI